MALAAPVIILGAGLVALFAMSGKKSGAATASSNANTNTQPSTSSTPNVSTSTATKAQGYQVEVVKAIELLGVNPETYEIDGTPSDEAIQYASGLVARMRADKFVAEAAALESLVKKAVAKRPAPIAVAVPSIPLALQQELNNVIKYSKDPKQLQAVADALKKLPNASTDPTIKNTIEMVEEMVAQLQAQAAIATTVQNIDVVLQSPTAPVTITTTTAASNPATVLYPAAIATPAPVTPVVTAPKSAVETAADLMVSHLLRLQTKYGMPGAKGKEDLSTVKKFQSLANLTADGKAGPGTMVAAAGYGQYNLPLVMYWTKSATAQNVYKYRDALNVIADKIASSNPSGANTLRASAANERGQAGIIGTKPA